MVWYIWLVCDSGHNSGGMVVDQTRLKSVRGSWVYWNYMWTEGSVIREVAATVSWYIRRGASVCLENLNSVVAWYVSLWRVCPAQSRKWYTWRGSGRRLINVRLWRGEKMCVVLLWCHLSVLWFLILFDYFILQFVFLYFDISLHYFVHLLSLFLFIYLICIF